MKKKIFMFLSILFLAFPVYALDNNDTLISPNPVSYEDKFVFKTGDNVSEDGNYNGSSLLAGNIIKNKGTYDGVTLNFGNVVNVETNSEYALIAGNAITFNGNISKDLAVFGKDLDIYGTVSRDAFLFGSSIKLQGTYSRDVKVYGSTVNLENVKITGDLYILGEDVTLGKDIEVTGSIKINKDAAVTNDNNIIYNTYNSDVKETSTWNYVLSYFVGLCSTLALFLVLALIIPKAFTGLNKKLDKLDVLSPFVLIGKGALLLIACPLLIVLLFSLYIGVYLALLLIVLFILILAFASLYVSYMVGYLVWKKLFKQEDNTLIVGLIGIIIVSLLQFIPVLAIFIELMGMGLIFDLIKFKKD